MIARVEQNHGSQPRAVTESNRARVVLIGAALLFLSLFLVVPLISVFVQAFGSGLRRYVESITAPDTLAAIRLTAITTLISVTLNTIFGVAAAYAIAKFSFRGKNFLLTCIDVPLSVSPVVSGLVFVLLFGRQGLLGPWLTSHDIQIIFAVPGIILATTFVTFPLVVREVLPVMQSQGDDEEEAAMLLGASGWQVFVRVTLPKAKWAILYGIILCNARAIGEFGAVSVVSGHIRGLTNTLPLHIEILYGEYNFAGAFAVASLMALLALLTLCLKRYVGSRGQPRVS